MFASSSASAWLTPPLVLLGFAAVPALLVYAPTLLLALRARLARSPQLTGIVLILTVVVLWTASSVAIQLIFESHRFAKPFFLTYASACLLMVYLPFYPDRVRDLVAYVAEQAGCSGQRRNGRRRFVAQYSPVAAAEREGHSGGADDADDAPLVVPLSTGQSVGVAMRVGSLWFALNLSFNVSLQLSSVSSVTIISATSSIWTLLIGAACVRKVPDRLKVAATLLSFFGVLLVMLAGTRHKHGSDAKPHMLAGDGVALVSAITYGAYAVQVQREVPNEGALPMPWLFGLVGLLCCATLWPCLALLHLSGLEPFRWPTPAAALVVASNALVGTVLANMLLARAMLLASPLLATVGLSLAIPLAMLSDVLRERITHFSPALALGSLAVWAGFFALGGADAIERRRAAERRGDNQGRARKGCKGKAWSAAVG